jgi:hypothetical protein
MANFWQRFFRKSTPTAASAPAEFPTYATRAINLLTNSDGQLEDAQVLDLFLANGIPQREATELLLFLPVAFCRNMLSQVQWHNYYWEYISDKKQIKRLYANNERYIIIQRALENYLAGNFTQADYLKIAGRSASFRAINQLLLDNPDRELTEISITPETVVY